MGIDRSKKGDPKAAPEFAGPARGGQPKPRRSSAPLPTDGLHPHRLSAAVEHGHHRLPLDGEWASA